MDVRYIDVCNSDMFNVIRHVVSQVARQIVRHVEHYLGRHHVVLHP